MGDTNRITCPFWALKRIYNKKINIIFIKKTPGKSDPIMLQIVLLFKCENLYLTYRK